MVTPLGCSASSTWEAVCTGALSGGKSLNDVPFFLPSSITENPTLTAREKGTFLQQLVKRLPCQVASPVLPCQGPSSAISKGGVAERSSSTCQCSTANRLTFAPTSHVPRSYQFCAAAVEEALKDAGLLVKKEEENHHRLPPASSRHLLLAPFSSLDRVGVQIGVGIPSITDICDVSAALLSNPKGESERTAEEGREGQEKGERRSAVPPASSIAYSKVHPFFVPKILGSSPAALISIAYGITGPTSSGVAACATGAYCIGEAARWIQLGLADVVVCGSTEACITPVAIAGFSRMRALSTAYHDSPSRASRPFDTKRDGFVMGEGAGILILESEEHAQARGWHKPRVSRDHGLSWCGSPSSLPSASGGDKWKNEDTGGVYGELRGIGFSSDAHHIAAPHPDGKGVERCIHLALNDGGSIPPEAVGYANAHATGTVGDVIELAALQRVLRPSSTSSTATSTTLNASKRQSGSLVSPLYVSSSKGALGHLLGAAGSVEAIIALLSLHHQFAPPNTNMEVPCWTTEEQDLRQVCLIPPPQCQSVSSSSARIEKEEAEETTDLSTIITVPSSEMSRTHSPQSDLHQREGNFRRSSVGNVAEEEAKSSRTRSPHCCGSERQPYGGKSLNHCHAVLSTSLGFGGLNSCLLFTQYF